MFNWKAFRFIWSVFGGVALFLYICFLITKWFGIITGTWIVFGILILGITILYGWLERE